MVVDKFIPPYPLKTAVLFLIFKRLDTTKQVFEAIKQAKPPKLYIAADGPRDHVEGEAEKVKAVREYVINNIDWDCEVKTLFREKNLGCGKAVSEAITWFFENEEQGIILEDDTVPSQSFFWFCEELLERYKNDKRVWHIGGYTLQENLIKTSYRFSRLIPIWGWATWRRAWKNYDYNMSDFVNQKDSIYKYFGKYKHRVKETFEYQYYYKIDTWDIQWAYTCVKNGAYSIIPSVSLIKNIGFSEEGTHTKKESKHDKQVNKNEISFPLVHPQDIIIDERLDEDYLSKFYYENLLTKLKSLIKRMLKRWEI